MEKSEPSDFTRREPLLPAVVAQRARASTGRWAESDLPALRRRATPASGRASRSSCSRRFSDRGRWLIICSACTARHMKHAGR